MWKPVAIEKRIGEETFYYRKKKRWKREQNEKKTFTYKTVNYDDIKSLFTINTAWQVTR